MESLIIQEVIIIDGSPEVVWDALTNPEKTRQYMFNCEIISNWQVGSKVLWNAQVNGNNTTLVSGILREFKPGYQLTFTTFDPNSTLKDIPENHVPVTYAIREKTGQTLVTVRQGDFAKVAQGRKRYEAAIANGGWVSILEQLKNVVESPVLQVA